MELKHIKDLMAAMTRHGMKRLFFEDGSIKLELEQAGEEPIANSSANVTLVEAEQAKPKAAPKKSLPESGEIPKKEGAAEAAAEAADAKFVTSPIVGTFYGAPSPEDPPFVKPGDRVDANTVVCIVEAMKVMNEVKAGVNGVIEEALVDNAHPVEFGTKLFRVREK